MTASNGAVVWSAYYDSFGDAEVDIATVENNLRLPARTTIKRRGCTGIGSGIMIRGWGGI